MKRKATWLSVAVVLALLWAPASADAQQAKVARIAILRAAPDTPEVQRNLGQFKQVLRESGYIEGQNVAIEYRFPSEKSDRLSDLAAELVRLKPDVIFAAAPAAVEATRKATKTIPIVALDLETDPIASGLIESLARPGGNITGVFLDMPEFTGKWLELLKEVVPGLSRVTVLWDPATGPVQLRAAEVAAKSLRVQLQLREARGPDDLEGAFRAFTGGRAQALLALSSPVFNNNKGYIADLAMKHRLPAIMLFPLFAEAGGLMAYGPNLRDLFAQVGRLVGKILKGTNPGELPVERPVRFELQPNLKTAKALGLAIPQSVLIRADQVIQ
jgi:putative ABC transport system substrate-binding protein